MKFYFVHKKNKYIEKIIKATATKCSIKNPEIFEKFPKIYRKTPTVCNLMKNEPPTEVFSR